MKWLSRILRGRTSRRAYALYWFLPSATLAAALSLIPPQQSLGIETVLIVAGLMTLPIDLVMGIRRFHDTGLSGWWFVLTAFPLFERLLALGLAYVSALSLPVLFLFENGGGRSTAITLLLIGLTIVAAICWWAIYRIFVRAGDVGPNRFGPDPLGARVRPSSP